MKHAALLRRLAVLGCIVAAGTMLDPTAVSAQSPRGTDGVEVRWVIAAEPHGRVGAHQGPDGEFGRVVGVVLLRAGKIAVADAGDQQIRVFDGMGALLTRWGRPGSGPGEFRNLVAIAGSMDSLLAFESAPGPSRFQAFHVVDGFVAGGELRDDVGSLRVLGRFPTGEFLVSRGGFRSVQPPPLGQLQRDTIDVGIFAPSSQPSVAWIGKQPNNTWLSFPSGSSVPPLAIARQPLGASLAAAASDRYAWILDSQSGRVRIYGIDGRLAREMTLPVRRYTLSDKRIQQMRVADLARAGNDFARLRIEAQYSRPTLPKYAPVFRRIVSGERATVWVDLGPTEDSRSSEAIVFTASGQSLARVVLPPGFVLWHAGEDFVAGVEADADGTESVVVYRLHRRR